MIERFSSCKKEVYLVRKLFNPVLMLGAVAVCLAIVVSGCDKPTAEMKRAEAAIEDAKKAGAAEYAADKLASAEDKLDGGVSEMNNWQYKQARASFEEAYRLALEAKEIALAAQGTEPPPPVYIPPPPPGAETHTVVKGECLWWIAEYREVYGDPFQWPLIYDANRDEIDSTANAHGFHSNEQDWIFPGQQFNIPEDASIDQVKNARKRAGAPAPYLPPGY